MNKINYKSDFDFVMRLVDCEGRDIGWPEFDWTARFWTWSKACSYTASCIGGECHNCRRDGEAIRILMDGHNLGSGRLHVELTVRMPDGDMPDGDRRTVSPVPLDIELVRETTACTCLPADIIAEVGIPWAFLHDTDAYNAILEKVNGEFDRILGVQPAPALEVKAKAEFRINPVIQRGLISIFSRPGMVYENKINCKLGAGVFMRLPFSSCDMFERTFDLSKVFPDGLPDGFEVCDAMWCIGNESRVSYDYDRERNFLTVAREVVAGDCGAVLYIPADGKYSMIDKNGRLRDFNTCSVNLFRVYPEAPIELEMSQGQVFVEPYGDILFKRHIWVGRKNGKNHGKGYCKRKWATVKRLPKCGIVKMRRRVGRKKSDWAIFSFAMSEQRERILHYDRLK